MWSLVLFKFKVGFPFDSPLNRFSLRTLAKLAISVSQKLGLLMARLQYYMYNVNNVKCTVFCLLFVLLLTVLNVAAASLACLFSQN